MCNYTAIFSLCLLRHVTMWPLQNVTHSFIKYSHHEFENFLIFSFIDFVGKARSRNADWSIGTSLLPLNYFVITGALAVTIANESITHALKNQRHGVSYSYISTTRRNALEAGSNFCHCITVHPWCARLQRNLKLWLVQSVLFAMFVGSENYSIIFTSS